MIQTLEASELRMPYEGLKSYSTRRRVDSEYSITATYKSLRFWSYMFFASMPFPPQPPKVRIYWLFDTLNLTFCSMPKCSLLVVDLQEATRQQLSQEKALMSRFSRLQNFQGLSEQYLHPRDCIDS
jgi:hypothetical protein